MYRQTFHVYSPGGGTFLGEMTLWPPSLSYDIKIENLIPSIDAFLLQEQSCQSLSQQFEMMEP